MVRLEGVGVRYGVAPAGVAPAGAAPDALVGVNLALPQGAFAWVIGRSGAGKTTLLRLLQLVMPPTHGRVMVLDHDAGGSDRAARAVLRRRIGCIRATPLLLDAMTVFDSTALPLRLDRRPEAIVRADVGELLGWLGLAGKAGLPTAVLTLGERHLVEIARAVAAQPALLLADEPTANLDDAMADQVMRLLWEMHALGTTVLVATHDERWPARLAGTLVRLDRGRRVDGG